MNKTIKKLMLFLIFLTPLEARSLSVPSYIEDTNDIKGNICKIIKEKTSGGVSFEDTALATAEKDAIIMKTISSLYAEGFTTITSLSKDPSVAGDFIDSSTPVTATDKKEVLEAEVQAQINHIAKRLNSIISLEAGIAELEGSMILRSLSNIQCPSEALSGEK